MSLPASRRVRALARRGDGQPVRKRRRRRRKADFSLETAKELARGIPRFGRLLFRLMKDPRVPLFDRALFGVTVAYLFVPVDVVPDWLPVVGQLDDLLLVAVALYRLLHRTPEHVILEHWQGDEDPLDVIRDLLDRVARVTPWWARKLLRAG